MVPRSNRCRDRTGLGARRPRARVAVPRVVLGLARGGVIVAAGVARALGASLDVVIARKLGAPGNPELGIGAVAPGVRVDGSSVWSRLLRRVADDYLERAKPRRSSQEIERRTLAYRGDRPPLELRGTTVDRRRRRRGHRRHRDRGAPMGPRARGRRRRSSPRRWGPRAPVARLAPDCDECIDPADPGDPAGCGTVVRDVRPDHRRRGSRGDQARIGRTATREGRRDRAGGALSSRSASAPLVYWVRRPFAGHDMTDQVLFALFVTGGPGGGSPRRRCSRSTPRSARGVRRSSMTCALRLVPRVCSPWPRSSSSPASSWAERRRLNRPASDRSACDEAAPSVRAVVRTNRCYKGVMAVPVRTRMIAVVAVAVRCSPLAGWASSGRATRRRCRPSRPTACSRPRAVACRGR